MHAKQAGADINCKRCHAHDASRGTSLAKAQNSINHRRVSPMHACDICPLHALH